MDEFDQAISFYHRNYDFCIEITTSSEKIEVYSMKTWP